MTLTFSITGCVNVRRTHTVQALSHSQPPHRDTAPATQVFTPAELAWFRKPLQTL